MEFIFIVDFMVLWFLFSFNSISIRIYNENGVRLVIIIFVNVFRFFCYFRIRF